ncbi:hypothetical protein Tco_0847444 [Tanacetum coccineum]
MSSDNASYAVTYTSISSDSNGLSCGIPLVNAGELPEMDPYEEVAQQGQAYPLSPAYVPNPIELDEHVPVYVPEPEHLEYHALSDDDVQSMELDFINYPDEPEDDYKDMEEDPKEDHTDYTADEEDRDEPSDDDDDDDDTVDEDKEPTKDEEEEEEHIRLTLLQYLLLTMAQKTVKLEPPMSASMEARIVEHAAAPIPPTIPTYDHEPLGHRAAMISESSAARPPRGQYDFVNTVVAGQGLIRSLGHDAQTIARAADRAEDVGYVKALKASEHRMMTSIEEVNLRLHNARTDRRDIRLDIDVVRGQRTTYETELHEVRHAYLSSEAQNRALLVRLETLETHMSRMKWQHQSAEDDAVRQMMGTHVLEARAQIDTVEDTGSSC